MITLINSNGDSFENPTITEIQKAFNELYLPKKDKNPLENYISLMNLNELEVRIYPQTVLLQDWGGWSYDGPGGPGELLLVRYKERSLFYKLEEAVELLANDEREKLTALLQALSKPE